MLGRKEVGENLGEGDSRIRDPDDDFPCGFERRGGQDGRAIAFLSREELRRFFGKGEIATSGAVRRGKPREKGVAITKDLALDDFGNFRGGVGDQKEKVRRRRLPAAKAPGEG